MSETFFVHIQEYHAVKHFKHNDMKPFFKTSSSSFLPRVTLALPDLLSSMVKQAQGNKDVRLIFFSLSEP